jgi:hypothetical protein
MYKLIFCIFCVTLGIHAKAIDLDFRLDVLDSVIAIGEPITVKCVLINKGIEACKIYCSPYEPLLSTATLSFTLFLPNSDDSFQYWTYRHVPSCRMPDFVLPSKDSIYWYTILNWKNWTWYNTDNNFDYLNDLPLGDYTLVGMYHSPLNDLDSISHILSNTDQFAAVKLSSEEFTTFKYTQEFIDHYFGYPGNMKTQIYEKMHQVLPKYIDKKTNAITEYCHYLLAFASTLPSRIDICKSFLSRYTNSHLAEDIEFWLARAYKGEQEDSSGIALRKVLGKYTSNARGYYYLNLKQKK